MIFPLAAIGQRDFTTLVNTFIGTGGHGHTYPGATMPFGMMQLSPDTRMADWDGSSGYHYSDSLIYGFSHTHLSGTGIPDYCDLLIMPFIGKDKWNKEEYRSGFRHANEKASPGYYEVKMENGIRAQLSTSYRSGMQQYQFPAGTKDAAIIIDLQHRDQLKGWELSQLNGHEINGFRRSRSWARDQQLYFHLETEAAITDYKVHEGKAIIRFAVLKDGVLRIRVGLSPVSEANAKQNLNAEIIHWNLDEVRNVARKTWNQSLGKLQVKGGTHDQQVAFYTALYHTMIVPNLFQDINGDYRGTDGTVYNTRGHVPYTVFSLWDTYRAYHPLMNLIEQKRSKDWISTFLDQYVKGGMLPVWELAANETFCMIGYHSVPVILDAYRKGFIKGNEQALLKAMTNYAESARFGLEQYRKQGYIGNDREHESVSKTLEYAYDDWCIATFAKLIGNDTVYQEYIQRAQYYKNVFDPSSGHMRGKVQAMWYRPFDAREINNFFTEGNSWQYSFAVPHDIETLITMHGGATAFEKKLDELFTTSSQTTGRDQADVTGLIGQYAHGNEPSHHMAYLFNYIGKPWKTEALVHDINTRFYLNSPDGLIGNEDCGQMSAWFIFSAMGFYPVCPGSNEYVLGTPLFDEVSVQLENGKKFVVKAQNNKPGNFYVQSVSLKGKKHTARYITAADILNGGTLGFVLGNTPNTTTIATTDLPHSKIDAARITPVPFVDISSNKFRDSTHVQLSVIDKAATIFYQLSDSTGSTAWKKYEGPFPVRSTCLVSTYALKDDAKSPVVQQQLFRVPGDISIEVKSAVQPMYTAGGPEALIDGIYGNINWKAGDWQSYFDKDFEAVIDLQRQRPVTFLGVHVLQDVSPWIMFPKAVIFYGSDDGIQYNEIARVDNMRPPVMDKVEMQLLGKQVNLSARYIRVKVLTGGSLPSWHESAGSPSHIFIDEVIIR